MNNTPQQSTAPSDSSEPAVPFPPRYRWLKRGVIAFVLLIVALGVVRWRWGVYAERRLQQAIDEIHARGEPILIEDFKYASIPDHQNAATYFEAAAEAMQQPAGTPLDIELLWSDPVLIRRYARHVDLWMEENGEALRLIERACECQEADWGVRLSSPILAIWSPKSRVQRKLTYFINTHALRAHQLGDDESAVRACRQLLRLATAAGQTAPLFGSYFTLASTNASAGGVIQAIAPTLRVGPINDGQVAGAPASREQVRDLIAVLLDDTPDDECLRRALYGERMTYLDNCNMVLASNPQVTGGTQVPTLVVRLGALLNPMFQLDCVYMIKLTDKLIEAAFQPNYPAFEAMQHESQTFSPGKRRYAHLLSVICYGDMRHAIFNRYRLQASRRMSATVLAIRLYELDHGRRPATLDELVPDYLPAIPTDPFTADNQPLRYCPDADPPVLYSIDRDGRDDGGVYCVATEFSLAAQPQDYLFLLNGERPGDRTMALKRIADAMKNDPNEEAY